MDMSRYQKGNPVLPGHYDLDIYINGKQVTRTRVEFVGGADRNIAEACFTSASLKWLGVDTQSLPAFSGCRKLKAVMGDTRSYADIGEQKRWEFFREHIMDADRIPRLA